MIPQSWRQLAAQDLAAYRLALTFLEGRLEERAVLQWALELGPRRDPERVAMRELLHDRLQMTLREPWRTAWELVEDSWQHAHIASVDHSTAYHVKDRLRSGDYSRSVLDLIASAVRPRVKVEQISEWQISEGVASRRPRRVQDLLSVQLTSGPVIDPDEIGLGDVADLRFLIELAENLDEGLADGLRLGRRIGWDGTGELWRLGDLRRAYFVPPAKRDSDEHEPDEFHRGIAPAVKLLQSVVDLVARIDVERARRFLDRWRDAGNPVHLRLWAALARNGAVVPIEEVEALLLGCDSETFWNVWKYPEVVELRALRFVEMRQEARGTLIRRVRRGPPRRFYGREGDGDATRQFCMVWKVRELRRIQIAGGDLPARVAHWVDAEAAKLGPAAELESLVSDFPGTSRASWVPPDPNWEFDRLEGLPRLAALERDLAASPRSWNDDPSRRASDWIQQTGRIQLILADLGGAPDVGAAYPSVWDRIAWLHRPTGRGQGSEEDQKQRHREAVGVLDMLRQLPDPAATVALGGITSWLDAWGSQELDRDRVAEVWLRLWPIALDAANRHVEERADDDLNSVVHGAAADEPEDLDTLNTPVGRLVGVFLGLCPSARKGDKPFESDPSLRRIRDTMLPSPGRAGLIARYRCIEALPYFQLTDPVWAGDQLIAPLLDNSGESLVLWRAVARRLHSRDALAKIGLAMVERATDLRLPRRTREALVWNLLVATLHALHRAEEPPVSNERVMQMLRSVDDETRAHAAGAVARFVSEMSSEQVEGEPRNTPESLLRSTARQFLERVWPQETTLTGPGVSRSFAQIPAASRGAFCEAVAVVERFLVPFDCWGLHDYGFADEGPSSLEAIVNAPDHAVALLRLLDRTIGQQDHSVAPHDLARAVEHMLRLVPRIREKQEFQRIAALARA